MSTSKTVIILTYRLSPLCRHSAVLKNWQCPLPPFRSHLRPTHAPFKVPRPHLKAINFTTYLSLLRAHSSCRKREMKGHRQNPSMPFRGPSLPPVVDKDKDGVGPITSADFCHCPKSDLDKCQAWEAWEGRGGPDWGP